MRLSDLIATFELELPGGCGLNFSSLFQCSLSFLILCKKESQVKSKKTDFSQEKSRKVNKKSIFFDFLLTFLDFS